MNIPNDETVVAWVGSHQWFCVVTLIGIILAAASIVDVWEYITSKHGSGT